jgi:diguanylate cyclase (GGDEF)-like protein
VVFAPEFEVAPAGSGAVEATAELVPRVAQMFRADGRRSDAIGRVGSTEIAVLAPGTDAGGAVKLAERFRRAMLAGTAEAGAGPAIELRAGYGAVGNVRYTPVDPKNLLARAARAVQLARAEGKWIRESSERP